MIRPNRRHPLAVLLGLVLVLGACGGDDDGEASPTTTAAEQTTSPPEDRASDDRSSASTGEDPPGPAVTFDSAEALESCLDESVAASLAPAEAGILTDAEGFRYCVGPALQVGIESATAVATPSGVSIEPVMTETGIEALNLLAGQCFEPDATNSSCPTGQIAIMADGQVLSAPTINAPSFGRDQIVIIGSFTIEEAETLAGAMAAEQQLSVRPVLLNLGPDGP